MENYDVTDKDIEDLKKEILEYSPFSYNEILMDIIYWK